MVCSCGRSIAEEATDSPDSVQVGASSENKSVDYSTRDQELLTELWQAYTKRSPDLLLVVEKLKKSGWDDSTIVGLLANPLPAAGDKRQRSGYGPPNMALTDPNFEPTYPVLHENGPSYLRVGRSKTLTYNGANIFAPGKSISQAERIAAMNTQAELIFLYHLVRGEAEFFVSYLKNCREIQALQLVRAVKNRASNARGKLTTEQFERLKILQSKRESSRAMLVYRVGEEAALRLDKEMQIGSSPSSSSSSSSDSDSSRPKEKI
ncbi:hypothetical protein KBI23_11995 [bacterium]|nr:hypothetical protein [bacterium]